MASIKSVLQFSSTVRHLRREQISGQIRKRLICLFERKEDLSSQSVIEYEGCKWDPIRDFLPPGLQFNSAADLLKGKFVFLNRQCNIGWPADWNQNSLPKLWLYNLHYFEYLWLLKYEQCKVIVIDWINNCTSLRNSIGWEPYPVSLRLLNFCGVFFGRFKEHTEADASFLQKLWKSIYIQAEWLSRNFETHLLGNHLFENAAALAVTGSCFEGQAAEKWLTKAIEILTEQIPEQILPDGMHFERSMMYHCRITYLLAMLNNTAQPRLIRLVKEPLKRAVSALKYLAHPDKQIALLNDSAFGIYNSPGQLLNYVRNLSVEYEEDIETETKGAFALPDAGYYGYRDSSGNYVICDAAPIGPDYIPGHAHADIFTFEMSLKGHRVIVDAGVYDYEQSDMRRYCRSTKAHNTVEIEGQDQCQMWATFRVARRGRPQDVKWVPKADSFVLSGRHDGYRRLKGRPEHFREFVFSKNDGLIIKDAIFASKPQNMISRIHLHPDCKIESMEENAAWIIYPGSKFRIIFSGDGKLSLEDSYYCPEFGLKIPNTTLTYSFTGCGAQSIFQIKED
jgi:uncharacterized heparinase superfamily protein